MEYRQYILDEYTKFMMGDRVIISCNRGKFQGSIVDMNEKSVFLENKNGRKLKFDLNRIIRISMVVLPGVGKGVKT